MRFCSWAALVLVAVAVGGAAAPARGQDAVPKEVTFDAVFQYGPHYPTQRWLPVRLGFRNPTDVPVAGTLVMPVAGVAEYRTPLVLPPQSRVSIITYAAFPVPPAREAGTREARASDTVSVVRWEGPDGSQAARIELLGRALTGGDPTPDPPALSRAAGAERAESRPPGSGRGGRGGGGGEGGTPGYDGEAPPLPTEGDERGVPPGSVVLATGGRVNSRAYSLKAFRRILHGLEDMPLIEAALPEAGLPVERTAYDAVRYFVWDMADAAEVGPAQQAALLDFVARGGVLVVPSPAGDAADPTDTFLGPHLPVRIVGKRQALQIDLPGDSGDAAGAEPRQPLRMREPVDLCEALAIEGDADSRVLLRDAHYVHAAYKPLGLGRVVFTSFPVNGPADGDPRVAELWRQLLATDDPRGDWAAVAFNEQKPELLQSMIGRATVSFGVATAVAAGFLLLALSAHLVLRGARRPHAFVATVAVAVGLTAVLLTLGAVQRGRQSLVGARLAVIDASPSGGGAHRELLAHLGAQREDFGLEATRPGVVVRPVVNKPTAPPVVVTDPFSVPRAGVHELTIERVWQAQGVLPDDRRAAATATFGPEGLRLSIENALGGAIERPLLLWGGRAVRLDDIPAAAAQHELIPRGVNPWGDFRNSTLVTDVDRLRGEVLAAIVTPAHGPPLGTRTEPVVQLAGWLTAGSDGDSALPPLVRAAGLNSAAGADSAGTSGAEPAPDMTAQVLVRMPVRIEPSPPGSTVRLDAEFMRLRPASFGLALYDPARDAWGGTNLDARMLLSYEPPRDAGTVRPTRATAELDMTAPGQTVRVRRGQAPGGVLTHVPGGPVLAEWDKPLGRQVLEFECGPDDVDADGRVWLLVTVDAVPLDDPAQRPPEWKVNAFRMSYVAEVTGPPAPPPLPARRSITPAGAPATEEDNVEPSGRPAGPPPRGGFRGRPPGDGNRAGAFRGKRPGTGGDEPRREPHGATSEPDE